MKKFISLILACILLLSLCACGNSAATTAESEPPKKIAANKSTKEVLDLGTTVDLGFAKFSFHSAVVDYKIGGSKSFIVCLDGMQYFCLLGTIQNTSGSELAVSSIDGTMTFNNTYSYSAKAAVVYSEYQKPALPALMEGTFVIYAEVPDALLEQLSDCTVQFSLNEQFDSTPTKEAPGKYIYEIYLSEEVCTAAKNGPSFEMQYFDECPILPNPASFGDARQHSRSTSYSNNKVSSVSYSFSTNPGSRSDIRDIYDQYLSGLKNEGFIIEQDNTSNHIYYGSTKLATVELQATNIRIEVTPGNENLADKSQIEEEGFSGEQTLALGTLIENDYLSMLLDNTGSASELRSGTGSNGRYYSYYSTSGDPFFYLTGTFKNLGSKPVDLRNAYVTFTFDNKYTYPGDMNGFVTNTGFFVNDVSPLSSVNCYVSAEVPRELINSFQTCQIRIGFSREFGYTMVDGETNLPLFKYCDNIYNILITR